ncbi:hypothetical protein [Microbulbifer aggregans]|uniref:hypothetical protein n=1 Tax=Microbulbifer aggregans TaxID=1769779 RepID=UPI001CFF1289|nr:hypothetical protein [Microbulbifer aggregans]
MSMKSLRVLLRQTMAIALLALPLESFGEDRRVALAIGDRTQSGTEEDLLHALQRLRIKASLIPSPADADSRVHFLPAPHTHSRNSLIELAPATARHELASAAYILHKLGSKDSLTFEPSSHNPSELQEIANYVADNVFPGAVLMVHPKHGEQQQLLDALPLISEQLRAKGYDFVPLSELLPAQDRSS